MTETDIQAEELKRIESLIAFRGTVELLNAAWSLDAGRTVELRLCGEAYDRVHPFKRFQQKRNGRVGTRFSAVFSQVSDGAPLLSMEVMLAAWKDSSSIGQSITLWLDNEVEMHPFCGCTRRKATNTGDVFALILVELNDDDTPVAQASHAEQVGRAGNATDVHDGTTTTPGTTAAGAQNAQTPGPTSGNREGPAKSGAAPRRPKKFSSSVHLLVTSPRFVQWLQETKGTLVKHWTPELARQYAKRAIRVESLSDLDRDRDAVRRFHDEIRRPYERWAYQKP